MFPAWSATPCKGPATRPGQTSRLWVSDASALGPVTQVMRSIGLLTLDFPQKAYTLHTPAGTFTRYSSTCNALFLPLPHLRQQLSCALSRSPHLPVQCLICLHVDYKPALPAPALWLCKRVSELFTFTILLLCVGSAEYLQFHHIVSGSACRATFSFDAQANRVDATKDKGFIRDCNLAFTTTNKDHFQACSSLLLRLTSLSSPLSQSLQCREQEEELQPVCALRAVVQGASRGTTTMPACRSPGAMTMITSEMSRQAALARPSSMLQPTALLAPCPLVSLLNTAQATTIRRLAASTR